MKGVWHGGVQRRCGRLLLGRRHGRGGGRWGSLADGHYWCRFERGRKWGGKTGSRGGGESTAFQGRSKAAARPEAQVSGAARPEKGDERGSGPNELQGLSGLARPFGPDGLKGSRANAGGKKRNQHTGLGQEK
jgi:hypothetical protein